MTRLLRLARLLAVTAMVLTFLGLVAAPSWADDGQVAVSVLPQEEGEVPTSTDDSANSTIFVVALFVVVTAIAIRVLGPQGTAVRPNEGFTRSQVWLKAFFIVAYFAIGTVFIPSLVVESTFLSAPPDQYQDLISSDSWGLIRDLIGSGVWLGVLVFGFWGLRRAQQRNII